MVRKNKTVIQEVPHEIHAQNALDLIGAEFKFDHSKGMAEWLKNSVDAYRRNGIKQEEQHVIFRFSDQGVPKSVVECIDFIGMTRTDIEKAVKIWFDPDAAKRGNKKGVKVYGGHGNGGKFYMRQMYKESRFVTYKDGFLNIFGFNAEKNYGYERGFEDKKMKPKEAMEYAQIDSLPVPMAIKKKILDGKTGFTLVRGISPEGVRSKFPVIREMDKFKNHPQARRILERANVSVVYNGDSLYALLKPDVLDPLDNFKEPRVYVVPEKLVLVDGKEKTEVMMTDDKHRAGRLTLRTSSEALLRGSKVGELNRIDILGEIGVIGSYHLSTDLGVRNFPDAAFIYGEFGPASENEATILETDSVSNDRAKLIPNDTSNALLEWIREKVDELAAEITAQKREDIKASERAIASKFNDVLNEWKNKHMDKILSDLFGSGGGGGGDGEDDHNRRGAKITAPSNGFDFKYPLAEIEVNTPSKLTLKVSVPEALPIGAVILFESKSASVNLESDNCVIKSDTLKATPEGYGVAFLDVVVVGLEIGTETAVTATAGKLSASISVKVIAPKEKKSGKSYPQVLLSGHNPDPLGLTQGSLMLGERHPVVYQRPQDVEANIYWINTASPLASKIRDRFPADSIQWRNFIFERYVDIFTKEAIHELARKDFANFNADSVDHKVAEVVRKMHESARDDLDSLLFDENYTP